MNQSDRTELVLVGITLLVAMVAGLAMGVGDHFKLDRFVASITPDFGVLFGADVVGGAVLVVLFLFVATGAKMLLGP
ncbi:MULTISPECIES: hypothetical protein [Haloferax]|uniref:Uncharacterized protein n=1 Tax=Haloferax marinum TaxID=2666143 RepID=A0A6A8G3H5_9EURY|nr:MULTISPECIES: hypothetical protein [Haloferax]KAB1196113.1 hypothetical protein Hfx1150_00750 [Haloferax sp. CBA1150]MRW95098.1 hypothetical protein [Haloferax marinum]